MRILYIDIDTLRPDHLGCYGYHRATSPNIDGLAKRGVRFDNFYCSDAPCLPSRAALFNGRLGIHTGVVNHGGVAADLRLEGAGRGFANAAGLAPWPQVMRRAGLHTVTVSSFASRHAAWWFYHGFDECFDPGKRGGETADEVAPIALDWIRRRARQDNWFLHVHFWDPHTPYRTPAAFGNPFAADPPPDWMTESIRARHYAGYGPHSAHEPQGRYPASRDWPRVPAEIASMDDYRRWIDGYDAGVRYADDHVGQLLSALAGQGVLDDTVILLSTDHGENLGELNVYGDHQTADHATCRLPMIICGPGVAQGAVDKGLRYNVDLAATMTEWAGGTCPARWDARSFAPVLRGASDPGRDALVVSQCAWSCQRGVRFGPYILLRTYHDGFKDFPPVMLFDIENDPHETHDLAAAKPDIAARGLALLERWHADMMSTSDSDTDPLWTVIREGGPFHVRGALDATCRRLEANGRAHHAEALRRRHAKPT